jgi:methyl-accepting chemotaxis protein
MASQMTIGRKLFLNFGAASVLTLAVGLFAWNAIGNVGGVSDRMVKVVAKKQFLSSDIGTAMESILAAERGILLRAFMKDKATMLQYNQDFDAGVARTRKRLEEIATLSESAEDRTLVTEIGSALEQIRQGHAEFWSNAEADRIEAAVEIYKNKTNPAIKQAVKMAEGSVTQQSEVMRKAAQDAQDVVARSGWITLVMIALSLFVAAGAGFIVRRINLSLRQGVAELFQSAEQVADAAAQVSSSSQSVAQGASEQAASLEETSASSEEINSMAHKNTDNSRSVAEVVTQSRQKFVETEQSLDQMVVAMTDINTQSDKISKIIKVIDEIAFQTNILALNAAVEAARAGEAGMGFAVVADEVRNLAQRCAQAARDTAVLIEESILKSAEGKLKVDQVATAIHAITRETANVKTLADEMNVGSQEQARGIDQIGKAIVQMEQVTQKTAANAEESASAAEQLTAQSASLREILGRLNDMVGGAETVTTARRA